MSEAPERLRFLATWFDAKYRDYLVNDEVQQDLRRFADEWERKDAEVDRLRLKAVELGEKVVQQGDEIERLTAELKAYHDRERRMAEKLPPTGN